MFDQTLLADHDGARKNTTIAASFMAQILIVGVLLIVPLLYTRTLPGIPAWDKLALRFAPPVPPPFEPVAVVESASTPAAARPAPVEFRPPVHTPTSVPPGPAVIELDRGLVTPPAIDPGATGATYMGLQLDLTRIIGPPAPPPVAEPAVEPVPDAPVRMSLGAQAAQLIDRVVPPYPRIAKQAGVSGTVKLLAIIGKDGTVRSVQVVEGHPLLTRAAEDAVLQWRYRPTLLNGQPVEVEAPVEVIFRLR